MLADFLFPLPRFDLLEDDETLDDTIGAVVGNTGIVTPSGIAVGTLDDTAGAAVGNTETILTIGIVVGILCDTVGAVTVGEKRTGSSVGGIVGGSCSTEKRAYLTESCDAL